MTTRTLTAMFDTRQDAEAAKERLRAASIDVTDVHVHDQSSAGFSRENYSTQQDKGVWASMKGAFMPDEDRHTYEEGVRRGGAVLTAEVEEGDADKAVAVLEDANTVDIDSRSADWRSGGWEGPATGSAFAFGTPGTASDTGMAAKGMTDTNEERIPIVQEQLVVGKREVNRGGVRVRSYIVETPVTEDVRLREENVSVERRAVDLPLSAADDAFRERTIEMTETNEEAVVGKTAHVKEELVIRKDQGERTETVSDTVRSTEVDVENLGDTATSKTGTFGTTGTDRL